MISNAINLYTILHLLIYIIIGYYYPNKWLHIIIISFLWEIFEYIVHKFNSNSFFKESSTNKIFDIIINLVGYYLGNIINLKHY